MPDHQLSDPQIGALLDYLAAGGPEADSRQTVRLASTAGAHEVALGRDLFFGLHGISGGGAACSSCHTIQDQRGTTGGSLGPDLTGVYSRYQDKALSQFLERDCFPRLPEAGGRLAVTSDESFAIRAFLQSAEAGRMWASGDHANGGR